MTGIITIKPKRQPVRKVNIAARAERVQNRKADQVAAYVARHAELAAGMAQKGAAK